ncbi:SGNH/GDSL hydrolase family protein [Brevundimonas sp.]|uniref:SGNH/GDSL hydrolase family protein n=1 Tax=Brevundimonas sp. TaxID=1871086 RepID=UPI003F726E1F
MRNLLSLTALLLAVAGGASAQTADPLPLNIGGRVIAEPDGGLSFGWPGVYFEGRFTGPAVRVRFETDTEFMRLLVDGQERQVFRAAGSVDVVIDGLSPGEHVVRLEKLTESQVGGGRFIGFFPAGGATPLPPRPRVRQIEFIGDSWTVGYGNTSTTRTCTTQEVHDRTDTQQAFGPVTARRFDADYRVNAWSGFGMVRNYDGGVRDLNLPTVYPRLKPDDVVRLAEADPRWTPQVIVINLGTNDFSTLLYPDEAWSDEAALRAAWRDRYVAFVGELHQAQPQARFILMGSDAFHAEVATVAGLLNAETPGLATPVYMGGLDLAGCDWHPSLADEAVLAGLVEGAIQQMGVWREE